MTARPALCPPPSNPPARHLRRSIAPPPSPPPAPLPRRLAALQAPAPQKSHGHLRPLLPFLLLRRFVRPWFAVLAFTNVHRQPARGIAYTTRCSQTARGRLLPICSASSKTYACPLPAPPHAPPPAPRPQPLHCTPTDPEQRAETDFFSGEPLRALSTLVYSDNIDLQRSASLTFAEITERGTRPTTPTPPLLLLPPLPTTRT